MSFNSIKHHFLVGIYFKLSLLFSSKAFTQVSFWENTIENLVSSLEIYEINGKWMPPHPPQKISFKSWDEVREWHGHIYMTTCKIDR